MSVYSQNTWERSFGTFPLRNDELSTAINHAIDTGYRAFDTAQMYENELAVGQTLANCGIARQDLCITTKVMPANYLASKFIASVEESLTALQVDVIDVLLLHWPPSDGNIKPSLLLLEQAAREGLTRHIGVSNYTSAMLEDATHIVNSPLVTNQVEFHPLLDQSILLEASEVTGIPLSSYCSVARGEIFKYELLSDIGATLEKSAAQVALRWILQKGVSINTMSTKAENIKANFDIVDFALSEEDMTRIDSLGSTNFRVVDKDRVPWAPSWD